MSDKIYIINNEIEFWPEKKLLRLANAPEPYCILNTPAAKCFELLLTQKGLVSHEDLYKFAWEKEAFEPSPNTLYQNMSILRRGLRKIGVSNPDIIVTVARKGFKLKDSTEIAISEISSSAFIMVDDDFALTRNSSEKSEINNQPYTFKYQTVIISLISILIVLMLAYNYYDHFSARAPLADYAFIAKHDDCLFYANKESDAQVSLKIKISILNCKTFPYNYVTQFATTSNFSVMTCNLPLKDKSAKTLCKAMYFRGYNGE